MGVWDSFRGRKIFENGHLDSKKTNVPFSCALLSLTGCGSGSDSGSSTTADSASDSNSSEIVDEKQNGLDMVVAESGYFINVSEYDGCHYIEYWALFHNLNEDDAIFQPMVYASAKDDSGTIIGASETQGANIAPGDTVLVVGSIYTDTNEPASIEIKKDGQIVYVTGGGITLTTPEQTVPFEINSCIEQVPDHDTVEVVLQERQ